MRVDRHKVNATGGAAWIYKFQPGPVRSLGVLRALRGSMFVNNPG